jgi:hypothetical protein
MSDTLEVVGQQVEGPEGRATRPKTLTEELNTGPAARHTREQS